MPELNVPVVSEVEAIIHQEILLCDHSSEKYSVALEVRDPVLQLRASPLDVQNPATVSLVQMVAVVDQLTGRN